MMGRIRTSLLNFRDKLTGNRTRQLQAQIDELKAEVNDFKTDSRIEIDEARRDSFRVAEMLDLIEHRLSEGKSAQRNPSAE